MTEEEKKAIENEDIEVLEYEINFRPINSNYDKKILRAIFRMLNKVKKQQKELEQEKEKNKENIKCIEEWINGERISTHCVHKEKIKEKIKEIENYTYISNEEMQQQDYAIIKLEELLDE